MNYRLATLMANKTMGASGTEIVDIDIADPISAIIVNQRSTNDGSTPDAHAVKVITTLEVVDGSDVLYSLSGYEAEAMDFYSTGQVRIRLLPYLDNVQLVIPYFLNFGRKLWDRQMALDPKKFTNPQLKITYDRDAGGDGCDALELEVLALCFDERRITPAGFLMQKQIKSWALANTTWEYTDLPTDYLYRNILILSRSAAKHPHAQFREIKLSEEYGKKIPYHELTMDLIKYLQFRYGPYTEFVRCNGGGTGGKTIYVTPAYQPFLTMSGSGGYYTHTYGAKIDGGGTVVIYSSAAGENFQSHVSGYCPHGAVCLPCFGEDEIEDYYNAQKLSSLRLEVKGGSSVGSGSTAEICIQQYRPY